MKDNKQQIEAAHKMHQDTNREWSRVKETPFDELLTLEDGESFTGFFVEKYNRKKTADKKEFTGYIFQRDGSSEKVCLPSCAAMRYFDDVDDLDRASIVYRIIHKGKRQIDGDKTYIDLFIEKSQA